MALQADDVDLGRDRALVERTQRGDDAAFEDLYRRYYARLYRFCLRRVGDGHEAEDVTQEAFTRAYRALPGLGGERRFYPWLSVIAARLCVDSHRRRSRSALAPVIDLGAVEGGQEAVLDVAEAALVERALDRLPAAQRRVLALREQHELPYREIARRLGVSVGVAEARLLRARRALRREFAALSDGGPGFLAGLPALGWLLRRTAAWRERLAAWVEGVGAPALASAAAAVVVTGSMSVFGGGGTQPAAGPPSAAPPAVAAMATRPAPAPRSPEGSASPPAPAPAAPDPAVARPPVVRGLETGMSYQAAKERSSKMPVNHEQQMPVAGAVMVGADPSVAVQDISAHVSAYVNQVRSAV
jgi:RNA polymerase sigma-70 factor (ECF subfamily)